MDTNLFKSLIRDQFDAALTMLEDAIADASDPTWDGPVGNLTYCQIAHHVLFFTDLYLGQSPIGFDSQEFHLQHADYFRDYEEHQDRPQSYRYDRATTRKYLTHCREKLHQALQEESQDSLTAACKFPRREFTRAELYVYNLRHLQHHLAQLSLLARNRDQVSVRWRG